jgi:HAD superfamily hydrolase (TIGR01490 family)
MECKSKIVFFDMDYTILENDCDVLWKNFLADLGLAPEEAKAKALYYLKLHQQGELPIEEYVQFQMKEFTGKTPAKMHELAQKHFDNYVLQYIYPQAKIEIEELKQSGAAVLLLSGTNEVIALPIADFLGFTGCIATQLELVEDRFTGRIAGNFLIRESKLQLATEYCRKNGVDLADAAFYADSVNDVFLLEKVGCAVVVNPNEHLKTIAKQNKWKSVFWSH